MCWWLGLGRKFAKLQLITAYHLLLLIKRMICAFQFCAFLWGWIKKGGVNEALPNDFFNFRLIVEILISNTLIIRSLLDRNLLRDQTLETWSKCLYKLIRPLNQQDLCCCGANSSDTHVRICMHACTYIYAHRWQSEGNFCYLKLSLKGAHNHLLAVKSAQKLSGRKLPITGEGLCGETT